MLNIAVSVPRDATADEAKRVIVRYLDKIPERTNERFALLAVAGSDLGWYPIVGNHRPYSVAEREPPAAITIEQIEALASRPNFGGKKCGQCGGS
jgi:hypothetical protein